MEYRPSDLLEILKKAYPLKMFTDEQRESIAANVPQESFEEGQVIYSEDDDATSLNLIVSGRVRLFLRVETDDPEGEEINLGELDSGDLFGLEAIEEGSNHLT